jgi:hypothetical protein
MWRDAGTVAILLVSLTACGDSGPAPAGFTSAATVDEAADRLDRWPVGPAPSD